MLLLTTAALSGAAGCSAPLPLLDGPTTYTIHPADADLAPYVLDAVEAWQPAVPYPLTVQIGGLQGEGYLVYRLADLDADLTLGFGHESVGEHAVGLTLPGQGWHRHEVRILRDVKSDWLGAVIAHEIGHTVGADHDDYCDEGVMIETGDIRGRMPAACEVAAVADKYR
jgi:hypothetical protein